MDVILLEKIKHLGNLGDRVSVKAGYARNFLIPQNKAALATPENLAEFESRRTEFEQAQTDALARAQARAMQLQEMTIVIASKVGLEGKLFGSVSAIDIVRAFNNANIPLTKQEVRLPNGPIRTIGDYEVPIHLHTDVTATVKLQVVAET